MNSPKHTASAGVAEATTKPGRHIDQVCDLYELAWQRGERPQISSFLDKADTAYRARLFRELVLVELEYRRNLGECPAVDDYRRDFPEFAEEIEAINLENGTAAFATMVGADDDAVRKPQHAPGERIGPFELVARVGSGGMGEVWKAWDPRLKRPVALKLPRAEALTTADLRRFVRESRAAAQLRYPQIAAVHDVCREGTTIYIIGDFVDGQNLRDYVAAQTPNYQATVELCAGVAEALHHAHEQQIVHRDLKPSNIIVDRSGTPHIIDFGLAKFTDDDGDLTIHGELLGTPAYMSPEQARGNGASVNRTTDVYSLGVVLYEMLTGRCPFIGDRSAVIHQIITCEPEPPRSVNRKIPRDLETICLKALEKEPSRRYATAQEMAVDLRRFARGDAIMARPFGPLKKSCRWVLHHRAITAAAVSLAVIVTTAAAMINSLKDENYKLQGYRLVVIDTEPPGARLAFVPIDERTGEPDQNPAGIIRPPGKSPIETRLKAGNYLIEAVLSADGNNADFAEVRRTIVPSETRSKHQPENAPLTYGDENVQRLEPIRIPRTNDVIKNMIAVRIDDDLRRGNTLLPALLYIDANETTPNGANRKRARPSDDQRFGESMNGWQIPVGKRIPSADEYDAIMKALSDGEPRYTTSGKPAPLDDLYAGAAEWTSTLYDYQKSGQSSYIASLHIMHVLKGYGDSTKLSGIRRTRDGTLIAPPDPRLPYIGFRGVRSGAPRFVAPN
jgi:serine/threonine protein kinase